MEEYVEDLKKNELVFESFWKELEKKLSDDIDATRHFLNKDVKTGEANSEPQSPNENPNKDERDAGQRQNHPDASTGVENIPMERVGGTGDRPKKSSNQSAKYVPISSGEPQSLQ